MIGMGNLCFFDLLVVFLLLKSPILFTRQNSTCITEFGENIPSSFISSSSFLSRLPLRSSHGFRIDGVFRPEVFGIASAHLLADFKVCRLPEAAQVFGQLHGLEAGREKLHQHGTLAVVHTWRVGHSEAFLQTHA